MSARRRVRAASHSEEDRHFDELYTATRRDLLAYLLRRTSTPEDAADLLAHTFLIAWEKHDQLPPPSEARPWLFGIARNLLRHDHRRDARVRSLSADLAAQLRRQEINNSPPPNQISPAGNALSAALEQLPPLDREIIELSSWDDLPPREIATLLGLSPNVVRVRAHRARARLKQLLASQTLHH